MGEARRMCFAMRGGRGNGICGAIQLLPALPKPGRDRLLHRPGRQEAWASTGIDDSVAHELSHPAVAAPAGRTPIRRI
jgi:hypothetical protein